MFLFFVYKFESQVFVVRQKQNRFFRQPLRNAIHTKRNVNFLSLFEVNLMLKQCGELKENALVGQMKLLFKKEIRSWSVLRISISISNCVTIM